MRRCLALAVLAFATTLSACTKVEPPTVTPLSVIRAHSNDIIALSFSSDGGTLLAADAGGFVNGYRSPGGELSVKMRGFGPSYTISFSPDSTMLFVARGTSLRVIDVRARATVHSFRSDLWMVSSIIKEGAILPDRTGVVFVNSYGDTSIWRFQDREVRPLLLSGIGWGHYSLAISPNGGHAAVGGFNKKVVKVIDLDAFENTDQIVSKSEGVRSLAFVPRGNSLVLAERNDTLTVWDWRTGETVRTLRQGLISSINTMATIPDASLFLTGQNDGSVALWDIESGLVSTHRAAHMGFVSALAVSRDGRFFASGGADDTIRIWALRDWQEPAS